MDIHAQTALLASLITTGVAVGAWLRAGDRRLAVLFAVFAGNVAIWHMSDFLSALTRDVGFIRLSMAAACALPLTAHRFFLAFLGGQTLSLEIDVHAKAARRLGHFLWLGAFAGALVALTPLIQHVLLRGILVGWVFLSMGVVLYQVHQRRIATPSRIERGRLAYLVLGGLIATAFAAVSLIPDLSPIIPSIGKVGVVVYLYLLSQAILRHRLLDLNELLAKLVALSCLAVLLGTIYGVIILFAGDDPALTVFNVLLVSFGLMALFEPVRLRFEHHVLGVVFAERALLGRVLDGLRREVPGIIEPAACAEHILDRIYETGRATHAAVYLLSENETGYRRIVFRGPEPPSWLDGTALRHVEHAAGSGHKAILRETVERRLQQTRRALPPALEEQEADETTEPEEIVRLRGLETCLERLSSGVLLPLIGAGRMVGLLSLYDERVYEAYSTSEIKGLIVVADLAATVVENSKLYERMKERDRLAALGEMAAGLAHEIRNPLGAIKAAVQYLEPKTLPDESGEFLEVILEEVDRLNGVVSQFLDYARPLKGSFSACDLGKLLKRTLRLLRPHDIQEGVEVVLTLADDLPPVLADPEQLRQVMINLILNAVQAMGESGRLELVTGRGGISSANEPSSAVYFAIFDDGPGIPADIRQNLFIPFFTTKDRGTGLGLPICQRIVENHGGRIDVHAREKAGTEFRVWLPVASRSMTEKQGAAIGEGDVAKT